MPWAWMGRGLRMVSDAVDEAAPEDGTTTLDVSPDGREVVYAPCERMAGYEPGSRKPELSYYEHELAVANLDSGQVWRRTANGDFDKYPSWSPDGQRIAFVSSGGEPHRWSDVHLYSMAADGTDVRNIAEGPLVHDTPRWSPDGERIAYVRFEGSGPDRKLAILVVGSDGGIAQRLTEAASGPSWSPDGERIAYAKVDGDEVALYTIGADGTDARRLATIDGWQPGRGEPDPARAWIEKVSWSPDGTKILVLANERAYPGIQIIAADGGGDTVLRVDNPRTDSIQDAAWSPDGTRLAVVGLFHGSGAAQSSGPTAHIALLTIGADGIAPRVLVGIRVEGSSLNRSLEGSLVGLAAVRGDISAEVAACGDGVAVANPEDNPGLVEDCKTLLAVQNALAGPGGLNWIVDRDISEWDGVIVEGAPQRVRQIVLHLRDLAGEIPTELSRLTELRVLAMPTNGLTGEIPGELGELENLEQLNLRENYLSGEIPRELGRLSELIGLSLAGNNLRGEIPRELGELKGLTGLSLGHNYLEGEIPPELGRLTRLAWLDLRNNRLDGEVPPELGQLSELRQLELAENELIGPIPAELGHLTQLQMLYVGDNLLTGCMPAELKRVENTDASTLGLPDCE